MKKQLVFILVFIASFTTSAKEHLDDSNFDEGILMVGTALAPFVNCIEVEANKVYTRENIINLSKESKGDFNLMVKKVTSPILAGCNSSLFNNETIVKIRAAGTLMKEDSSFVDGVQTGSYSYANSNLISRLISLILREKIDLATYRK